MRQIDAANTIMLFLVDNCNSGQFYKPCQLRYVINANNKHIYGNGPGTIISTTRNGRVGQVQVWQNSYV